MHHVRIGTDSSLNFLKYGPEVTVEPGPLEDFFNIQVQLAGCVRTRCGTQIESIQPGDAGVLSASEYGAMDWSRDSAMLIFCVRRKLIEGKLQTLIGSYLRDPLVFNTKMSQQLPDSSSWLRTIRFLQEEIDRGCGLLTRPAAAAGLEESLVVSLLYAQPHNYSHLLHGEVPCVAPAHVKRVESFIQDHAGESITIEELAQVAQTSIRSVFAGFRKYRATTPMKYLRSVRLDNVHRDLLAASPGASVTEIATRWGFVQLGRFSAEYKARFGRLPSETLRRAQQVN